jgi:hypothetical protein
MITARQICQQFANQHKIIFEDKGEIGFGRPCVGFIRGHGYIDVNPRQLEEPFDHLEAFYDERLSFCAPFNAYKKHSCLAVLVPHDDYESAIEQLANWVESLNKIGIEIQSYSTGATGTQAIFSGIIAYAVKVKEDIFHAGA